MNELTTSLRMWLGTLVVCCVLYTALILGIGQLFVPEKAGGSLVEVDGVVVGSAQIAQDFDQPGYFWPRPSAVNYDAAATGGSNLSPTNVLLTERAVEILRALDVPAGTAVPPDLLAASGSGMDPHITLDAALVQASRIAAARGVPAAEVAALAEEMAFSPSGLPSGDRVVTVLLLNIALNERFPMPEGAPGAAPDSVSTGEVAAL